MPLSKAIMITGGSGLVGQHLARQLVQRQYKVVILSRNPDKQKPFHPDVRYAYWDTSRQYIDPAAFHKVIGIVNLAGAGVVDKPWTEAYKHEIAQSRVHSGITLIKSLQTQEHMVQAVVSASAIGWYGPDRPGHIFTEADPADPSFLGNTCQAWEQSVQGIADMGIRLTKLRIGIVLSNHGGALAEFKKPLRFRIAGVLGHGQQMVSWIHADDLCRMMIYALENTGVQGVYNAVAPQPVSNAALTHALAQSLYGKAYISMPVPAFVLRLMMGERSIEVLKSATVSSAKIQAAGFPFRYSTIEAAMRSLAHHDKDDEDDDR